MLPFSPLHHHAPRLPPPRLPPPPTFSEALIRCLAPDVGSTIDVAQSALSREAHLLAEVSRLRGQLDTSHGALKRARSEVRDLTEALRASILSAKHHEERNQESRERDLQC